MKPIPFSIVAPATILLFGAAVTGFTLIFGIQELDARAAQVSQARAELLATTAAQRLVHERQADIEASLPGLAARCECQLLLQSNQGAVRMQSGDFAIANDDAARLVGREGRVALGSLSYDYHRIQLPALSSYLVAVVPLADTRLSAQAMVSSVVAFASLLLALAGVVGWALSRDVHADVLYVRDRIERMAEETGPPELQAIPVRTIDQVGELTAAFNMLLERFHAAERAYQQDLLQARDFDEDRSAFLAALSHELRTPLNAILGFADVLLDEIDGPLSEEARENLTQVRTSGEHLRSLIDDILALSALESGEFRLSREKLNLASVARDVVTEAQVTASQKGLTISLETPADAARSTAFADRRRMRQILQNVVSNAVKFTSSGSIKVHIEREGDTIMTSVHDTGPGIAKEQLEAIFEEFRQVDARKTQTSGTGLGLSITRRLVQMHGGSVRVRSELGKGSTFLIRIPMDETTANSKLPPLVSQVSEPVIREVE